MRKLLTNITSVKIMATVSRPNIEVNNEEF